MGKLLIKLLVSLITFIEHDERLLKNVKVTHEADGWLSWYKFPGDLLKHVDGGAAWTVTVAYGKGALYSIAIITIIILAYLVMNIARWRRARVFISYQHLLEDVANGIADRLKGRHFNPIKLPFVDSPNHDALLDDVKARMSQADLVVCIPGTQPSFVEHEVMMAFALEKPLILVSTNDHLSRIPNTAKRGYPIVNLNSLDEGGWNSFCNFCLYVAGYNMALVNMSLCVLSRFFRVLVWLVVVYLALLAALAVLADKATVSRHIGAIEAAIIICVVGFFVLPQLAFTGLRMMLAKNLRRAIGNQGFDLSMAPARLSYNLRKAEIVDILFKGRVVFDHDKEPAVFIAEKTVVPTEVGDSQDVQLVLAEAARGDAKAQFRWGQLLHAGNGCPQDKAEASVWFRKAAQQGLAEAQYNLGLLFAQGDGIEQNDQRAAHWYLQAAAQGHALAQNNLAELYHEGRGVEQDYAAALRFYLAAAEKGVASAAYNAGHLCLNGLHVKRDRDKARALFEQAADASFTLAYYALGVIYENGLGVKKDKQKAKACYQSAAADGDTDAQAAVKRLSKRAWQFWKRA